MLTVNSDISSQFNYTRFILIFPITKVVLSRFPSNNHVSGSRVVSAFAGELGINRLRMAVLPIGTPPDPPFEPHVEQKY